MQKTFILGVGAQKSGTSWFYNSLFSSDLFCHGITKEYHVFDVNTCFLEKKKWLYNELLNTLNKNQLLNNQNKKKLLKNFLFVEDPSTYFDYFDYLSIKNPKKKLFCDFTPSYSGLSINTFQFIRENLIKKGFRVKVIFLMREPFQRALSAAKHWVNSRNLIQDENFKFDNAEDFLHKYFKTNLFESRGRYDLTINNLESVFKSNEIFYEFYENLFTNNFINNFQLFLDSESYEPDLKKVVNQSKIQEELIIEKSLVMDIKSHYKVVYSYVENKFGPKVRNIWSL